MILNYDLTHVDNNLKAGDSGLLTVVIQNVGTQAAENVAGEHPRSRRHIGQQKIRRWKDRAARIKNRFDNDNDIKRRIRRSAYNKRADILRRLTTIRRKKERSTDCMGPPHSGLWEREFPVKR